LAVRGLQTRDYRGRKNKFGQQLEQRRKKRVIMESVGPFCGEWLKRNRRKKRRKSQYLGV